MGAYRPAGRRRAAEARTCSGSRAAPRATGRPDRCRYRRGCHGRRHHRSRPPPRRRVARTRARPDPSREGMSCRPVSRPPPLPQDSPRAVTFIALGRDQPVARLEQLLGGDGAAADLDVRHAQPSVAGGNEDSVVEYTADRAGRLPRWLGSRGSDHDGDLSACVDRLRMRPRRAERPVVAGAHESSQPFGGQIPGDPPVMRRTRLCTRGRCSW